MVDSLNRLVSIFLESAELRVKFRKTLTLDYWRNTADKILPDHDVSLLRSRGQHSNAAMKEIVSKEYDAFEKHRKGMKLLLRINRICRNRKQK